MKQSKRILTLHSLARGGLAAVVLLALAQFGTGFADDRDDDTVRVMTRNLYQGANLDPLSAPDTDTFPELLAAAGQAVLDIRASKPAERAAAVAREIIRNRVDLAGFQEAVILRTGPFKSAY